MSLTAVKSGFSSFSPFLTLSLFSSFVGRLQKQHDGVARLLRGQLLPGHQETADRDVLEEPDAQAEALHPDPAGDPHPHSAVRGLVGHLPRRWRRLHADFQAGRSLPKAIALIGDLPLVSVPQFFLSSCLAPFYHQASSSDSLTWL